MNPQSPDNKIDDELIQTLTADLAPVSPANIKLNWLMWVLVSTVSVVVYLSIEGYRRDVGACLRRVSVNPIDMKIWLFAGASLWASWMSLRLALPYPDEQRRSRWALSLLPLLLMSTALILWMQQGFQAGFASHLEHFFHECGCTVGGILAGLPSLITLLVLTYRLAPLRSWTIAWMATFASLMVAALAQSLHCGNDQTVHLITAHFGPILILSGLLVVPTAKIMGHWMTAHRGQNKSKNEG